MRELAERPITDATLAFLSARQPPWAAIPDESVHLAAALATIGFRHVVALRPIRDEHAVQVTDTFYGALGRERPLGDRDVTRAQHRAVLERRRARPDVLEFWGPYIHVGP